MALLSTTKHFSPPHFQLQGSATRLMGAFVIPVLGGALLFAGAPKAHAVTVLDNIGSSAFPGSSGQRVLTNTNINIKAFSTPNNGKVWNIDSLKLALASGSASPVTRSIDITLYASTTGTCGGTFGCSVPSGNALATYNFSGSFSNTGLNSSGYTLLQSPAQLGALTSFALQPNTP